MPEPKRTAPPFQKRKKICFFGAQGHSRRLKIVSVLRYILTLRFRDAASPGAMYTVNAMNRLCLFYWSVPHRPIFNLCVKDFSLRSERQRERCRQLFFPLRRPSSINLIAAAILFAAQTKIFPLSLHKKIIVKRRAAGTERYCTCFPKK